MANDCQGRITLRIGSGGITSTEILADQSATEEFLRSFLDHDQVRHILEQLNEAAKLHLPQGPRTR
jgi:hypothetical protein